MTRILLCFFVILLNLSCTKKEGFSEGKPIYAVQLADSIKVNYLGNLVVFDFEAETGLYLGRNNATEEILLFDDTGEIKHQFTMHTDGPNAITWAMGIGFLDGHVSILDRKMGIVTFTHKGSIKNVTSIPNEYFYLNSLDFAAQKLGNELAYIKPMREEFDLSDWSKTFKSIYSGPILELLEPGTSRIRTTMPFPPNTIYEDGNYYHWTFPIIRKNENEWLVSLLAERKYHVYSQKEGEIQFDRTVDLAIEDAIDIRGVPLSRNSEMQEASKFNIFGKIEQIYHKGDKILVIYTKGIPEERVKQQNREDPIKWMQFIYSIPRYLAVLDQNHLLLEKDILLPGHMIFTSVLSGKGEIIAVKNQESLGLEEDDVTVYKLNVESK
ncbi:hypothetical protein [Pleomorphovibrio marinus]|uniref:hypothetical protein n=1 Tax=Pleomorphovibrio marinus TaxID=2164132 RepID=UPI000E0A8A03|nr:hypothetical protein [Pleomorphovibrio marinus]